MCVLNFRSIGPTGQPAEPKQTHRQTIPKILPLPLTWEVKMWVKSEINFISLIDTIIDMDRQLVISIWG